MGGWAPREKRRDDPPTPPPPSLLSPSLCCPSRRWDARSKARLRLTPPSESPFRGRPPRPPADTTPACLPGPTPPPATLAKAHARTHLQTCTYPRTYPQKTVASTDTHTHTHTHTNQPKHIPLVERGSNTPTHKWWFGHNTCTQKHPPASRVLCLLGMSRGKASKET